MLRVLGLPLAGLLFTLLWLYCVIDVISTDESLVRNLPKTLWVVFVVLVFPVGSVAWLAAGRPRYAGIRPGDTTYRPTRRYVGPDDDPVFTGTTSLPPIEARRLQEWEDDLVRREEELRKGEEPA